ncbi:hypothetical protein BTVI_50940 [Pitangus sulphuratus]|nr:hypothetical protein BTVI_50940 [Pitangus sulphuratus]
MAEQFATLVQELCTQENLPYATWCQLAVARCAQNLFHGPAEAVALVEATWFFLRQERDLRQHLGLRDGFGEHVSAAHSCRAFATRMHLERGQPARAATPLQRTAGLQVARQTARRIYTRTTGITPVKTETDGAVLSRVETFRNYYKCFRLK